MADWSSLPADLVNRVADCLLSTNDLDWYMDLRAVCHNWRSATSDPRACAGEPRFWPRSWVMLDDTKPAGSGGDDDDDTHLFVNTETGRFLRKRLPVRDAGFYLVTTTTGGFVVLADWNPPHAARVLNPFTGSLTRFMAPKPEEVYLTAAVFSVSGSAANPFTLVLASYESHTVYWANPESEAFVVNTDPGRPSRLLPYHAGQYVVPYAGPAGIDTLVVCLKPLENNDHCIQVFKKAASQEEEVAFKHVTSIGNHALFVGARRCLLVDADKLHSVEANRVYYMLNSFNYYGIFMSDVDTGKAEMIAGSVTDNPVSLIQLLIKYTMHLPCDEQLRAREQARYEPFLSAQAFLDHPDLPGLFANRLGTILDALEDIDDDDEFQFDI